MSNTNLAYNDNNNVVSLNDDSLFSRIQLTLNSRSENTRKQYISELNNFFMFAVNKKIDDLQWEDLTNKSRINAFTVGKYIQYLKNDVFTREGEHLSDKTINHRIGAVKSFFKEMRAYDSSIDSHIFNAVKREREEKNHWGALSEKEINDLLAYCKTEIYLPVEKSILFETMYATGLRKNAVLRIKWSNITKKYDAMDDIYYYNLNMFDKGKTFDTPIPDRIYDLWLSIKIEGQDELFTLCDDTVRKTFSDFCEEYGIDRKGRNLSCHSLKHSGTLKILKDNNNDLEVAQKYTHHEDKRTTLEYTNDISKGIKNNPIYSFYDKTDISSLQDFTKEEIIAMINLCSESVKKEIINNKDRI